MADQEQTPRKPNILVIWGDDIGWQNVSAYGMGTMGYTTPNIDRIGQDGIRFVDHYAQPSCTAGRAAFITGQYPIRSGMTTVGMPGDTLGLLTRCNAAVHDRVAYVVRLAHGVQDPGATLRMGHGSCRDSAWLQVNLMRRLGIAARFCSGYLVEPETERHGDRADLHAWTEVWLPGAGWIGLDATSGLFCAEGHVLLAAGPDPGFCAPISGSHTAAEAELSFSLHLERLQPEHRTPATIPWNG